MEGLLPPPEKVKDPRLITSEAVKVQEAEALKLKEAEAAKQKEAEALKLKEAEALKVKEAEALKVKEAEAEKVKEAEVVKEKERVQKIEQLAAQIKSTKAKNLDYDKWLAYVPSKDMLMEVEEAPATSKR